MTMTNAANGTNGTAEQVKETAGQVIDQATDKAAQLVDQAKEQARPALQNQKERAVSGLGTTAEALRKSSQHLREQDQETVAHYMDQAAERVEQLGGYLRGHDLDALVVDAEQFARRQPGLFISGAFALGLLGARLLKSSSQRADAAARQRRFGSAGERPSTFGSASTSSGSRQAGAGNGATSSAPSEPAWTSRDERASTHLADTSGFGSPATGNHPGLTSTTHEAAR